MSRVSTFTPERVAFVEANIDQLGATATAAHLGIAYQTLYRYLNKIGRKVKPSLRIHRVPVNSFKDIVLPEVAYLLGLLWSDGHLSKKDNSVSIEALQEDLDTVKEVFTKTGDWCRYERTRRGRIKPVVALVACNGPLHSFLHQHDYTEKSVKSPCKILNHIPESFRKYFWRGFLDGDGCIYNNGPWQQISFAGSYAQDWTALEKLLQDMDMPYRLKRTIRGNGKSSIIRITQRDGCQRLLKYFYEGYDTDLIGLPRKHAKAVTVIAKTFDRYREPFRRKIKPALESS